MQSTKVFPGSVIYIFPILYYTLPKIWLLIIVKYTNFFTGILPSLLGMGARCSHGSLWKLPNMKATKQIQTPSFKRVLLKQNFKVNKSNKFTLMGRWEGARASCASEVSYSWMLPLPLLSPEACAKSNCWEEIHKSQGKKQDLQGIGH